MSRGDEDDPIRWSVAEFLRQLLPILIAKRDGLPCNFWWDSNPRRDAEIADLGLTKPLALEEMLNLTSAHHHAGPEKDDWELERCAVHKFRYALSQEGGASVDVYVKVGLKEHPKRAGIYIAKIYSFKRWK